MVMVPDTTSVSPGAVKCSVRSPAAPLIARFVKLATPLPVVVAVSVPPHLPAPLAIAAVTPPPPPPPRVPLPPRRLTPRLLAEGVPPCARARGGGVGRDPVPPPAARAAP